jgi:transcriptional regulator with XRE-family HTH domain
MDSRLNSIVAANIKRYRKQAGLSQEELGEKAGLHRTYIGSVERGERNITLDSLQEIADALHIAPVQLVTEENQDV